MPGTQEPQKPEIDIPQVVPPPLMEPKDDPVPDLHDDPPPETVNVSQEDEAEQAQSVADGQLQADHDRFGLSPSSKVRSGDIDDDVQDLVDHMNDMVASGRIDMDAYRGERNDDDEEGSLGPAGARE